VVAQLLERVPGLAQTGSTRALAFVALAVALLAGLGVAALARGGGADAPGGARGLGRCMVAALALIAGVLVPVESIGVPQRIPSPPDLLDAGAGGMGATLRGEAPAADGAVAILANGREVGRAPVRAAAGAGKDGTWEWRWVGSQRLEEGLLHLEVRAGDRTRAEWWLDLTRVPRVSLRWLVPLLALALLLAAALVRPAWIAPGVLFLAIGEPAFFRLRLDATTPGDPVAGGGG